MSETKHKCQKVMFPAGSFQMETRSKAHHQENTHHSSGSLHFHTYPYYWGGIIRGKRYIPSLQQSCQLTIAGLTKALLAGLGTRNPLPRFCKLYDAVDGCEPISHHLRNPGLMFPLGIPTNKGFSHGFSKWCETDIATIHSMLKLQNYGSGFRVPGPGIFTMDSLDPQ